MHPIRSSHASPFPAVRGCICLLALLAAPSPARAPDLTDETMGYSITIPPDWERTVLDVHEHFFMDSTGGYGAFLTIAREEMDTAAFPSPESWVRARFLGYLAEVGEYAGETVFHDSSPSNRLGALWSPEAFSIYPPGDTTPATGDYVRFCAVKGFGYQLIAEGDSADLAGNVDFYAGILSTVRITAPAGVSGRRDSRRPPAALGDWRWEYDLKGRALRPRP